MQEQSKEQKGRIVIVVFNMNRRNAKYEPTKNCLNSIIANVDHGQSTFSTPEKSKLTNKLFYFINVFNKQRTRLQRNVTPVL